MMVTTAMTARSTMVTQNRLFEMMQVLATTWGTPLSKPIYVQPQKGSWPFPVSSNSHSAGHNAPSTVTFSKEAVHGLGRHLHAGSLARPRCFDLETNGMPQQGHRCRSTALLR